MFLVATYVMKPRDPKRTKEKGYMKNPDNIQFDEQLYVTRKLNKKDQEYAKIIIDFTSKSVVRNGFNDALTYRDLVKYFYNGYPNYLKPVLQGMDPGMYHDLQQNVQAKEKAGSGSERAAETQPTESRQDNPGTELDDRAVASDSNAT